MLHVVVVAHRNQHAAGPRMQGGGVDLRLMIEIEFFERLLLQMLQSALLGVDVLGDGEDDENHQRESHAVDGGVLFRKQIRDRDEAQNQSGDAQARSGISTLPSRMLKGNLYSWSCRW